MLVAVDAACVMVWLTTCVTVAVMVAMLRCSDGGALAGDVGEVVDNKLGCQTSF